MDKQNYLLAAVTCKTCNHWRNKQSIFDFAENKGICLKAPEDSHVGFHHPNLKTFIKNKNGKIIPSFYTFSDQENERAEYFITRETFGCIKFQSKQQPTTN